MSGAVFNVPPALRRGNDRQRESESIARGMALVKLMSDALGLTDLGRSRVLDVGCGHRLVQAILQHDLPLGHYVGIDVCLELIEYFHDQVNDSRFHFQYLNIHNPMYNPEGVPLSPEIRPLLDEHSFDIICLFSVFIHLAPHDYSAMLRMLRHYIRPDGRLIFSLLLNETTAGGHGFRDQLARDREHRGGEMLDGRGDLLTSAEGSGGPEFLDWDPQQPLKWAIYSRSHALRLIEEAGWQVESVHDPLDIIQHHIVCKPRPAC